MGLPHVASRRFREDRPSWMPCAQSSVSRGEGLQALWGVNDKLLAENLERLHSYRDIADANFLGDAELSRLVSPRSSLMWAFNSAAWRRTCSTPPRSSGCRHLWVLSALYGCVRPFDAVQPYRLEMGAKLSVDGEKNLYAFWGDSIARAVCAGSDAYPGDVVEIVNLASVEYSKAVLPHRPDGARELTCIFGEGLRNGRPIQRSTASKIARGSMVRWMAGVECIALRSLSVSTLAIHSTPIYPREMRKGRPLSS